MSLRVERAGLLTTVQDLGRHGFQHLGVMVNGAMDELSHRMANALVGNAEDDATLELTLSGPTLRLGCDAVIAVCGADMDARVDGQPLPSWRPARVPAGARLEFGRATRGARAYLAMAGGFDLPPVMGSRSTAQRGGFGGFRGRALRRGDVIPLRSPEEAHTPRWVRLLSRARRGVAYPSWSVAHTEVPMPREGQVIRAVPGRHWQIFTLKTREQFAGVPYRVLLDSDRMGYRLEGLALAAPRGGDVLSEGMATGAVQVPPSGQPIVLMADRATTGGYPVLAVVAAVDLPLMAQLAPGDQLRFELITVLESHALLAARERQLARTAEALRAQLA
ncbi:MAG: biotin-dependent carboxyltransferase family protein [Betaproteobacteria bacterium]